MPRRLENVDPAELARFAHLTYPAVVKIITQNYADTARILALQSDGIVAGLAIAVPGPHRQFELLSLHVAPMLRSMGHGRDMLRALEDDFRARDFTLGVHFMTVPQDNQAYPRFFVNAGWSRPVIKSLICRSTMPLAFETPWLVDAVLPQRYRLIDWHSLDAAQRQTLAGMTDSIADELNPFRNEHDCDTDTSIAMVDADGGRVRGWVINHRLDDDTLRWTCSYLEPSLQNSALMCAIWLEVARRQRARTPCIDFSFSIAITEPRMARFAVRRMKPWLSDLSYGCQTIKKVA